MDNNLFRKKSIKRVNSPEQLNEYIHVSRPSVWLILGAIIILFIGVLVWGIFGTIHTTVKTGAVVNGDSAFCYVTPAQAEQLQEGMTVTVGDAEGKITSVSKVPAKIPEDADDYLLFLTGVAKGDFCYSVNFSVSGVSDGVQEAVIIVDSIHPISFIIQ